MKYKIKILFLAPIFMLGFLIYDELRPRLASYNNILICRELKKGITVRALRRSLGEPKIVTPEKIFYWGEPAGYDIVAHLNPQTSEVISLNCPETALPNWK